MGDFHFFKEIGGKMLIGKCHANLPPASIRPGNFEFGSVETVKFGKKCLPDFGADLHHFGSGGGEFLGGNPGDNKSVFTGESGGKI